MAMNLSFEQTFVLASSVMFAAEVGVSAALGRPLHRWRESLPALSLSAFTGFVSGFGKLFLAAVYVPFGAATALFAWHGTPLDWLLAWLAYDFFAYWFHRWSHQTALGWAVHVVHHQSEHLNWAAATRTAPFRSLLDWPTILPLAVLGVPIEAVAVLYVLHAAQQTVIHVVWVPKLGPLEWVLNTPSHHRVHHACNGRYLDANYGAHIILWDRLFGTFVPEEDAPRYGVRDPLPGWDPFRATFAPFRAVWESARGWSPLDRLRVWFEPPGWTPHGVEAHAMPAPREDTRLPHLGFAVFTTLLTVALFGAASAPKLALAARLVCAVLAVFALRASGRYLDAPGRPNAVVAKAQGGA